MHLRKAFTLIELLVVIAIIALLMSILMPALERVRKQARTIGCLANMKSWGLVATMYAEENDGKLWSGMGSTGYYWPWQLDDKVKDWKRNKTWFCPSAKKPIVDEDGNSSRTFNIWSAWGIYEGNQGRYSSGPNGIAGSYGLNGYVLSTPANSTYEGGVPRKNGWQTASDGGGFEVPLFVDALRFDLWPLDTHGPASSEFAAWSSNNMARCAINRHDGHVCCVFLDQTARKVGLKELWTLKWHKAFNTAGIWTTAGGATSDDWPEWMRGFKDY